MRAWEVKLEAAIVSSHALRNESSLSLDPTATASLDIRPDPTQSFNPPPSIYAIEILIILMSSSGFSLYTLAFSIRCTTSKPATARPNIVCLSSSHGYCHN